MGDPNIPTLVVRAKKIREAIYVKAGVSDAGVSDFSDDSEVGDEVRGLELEQEVDGEEAVTITNFPPPTFITTTEDNNLKVLVMLLAPLLCW